MVTNKHSLVTFGINSICQDGKHIVFIDIDINDYDVVRSIVNELQKTDDLSDFYIFNTNKGFHAVCLDKIDLNYAVNLLSPYEHIDNKYLEFALKRNNFTLRWGIDKQYYTIAKHQSTKYEKSFAHYTFLRYILNIKVYEYSRGCYDNSGLIEIQAYRSDKNGWSCIKL